MNFFTRSSSPTLRLGVCAALSLALMVSDHHRQHAVWVRSALSVVVYPVRLAVSTLFVELPGDAVAWLSTRDALIRESESLRHQLLVLGSRLERLQELEGENRRLRELLESSARIEDRVLVASVLGVDIDPTSSGLVLDKGTQHGIRSGQSVIDANGILNVSAKDKATQREQSIVIRASSGLSDEEIERMVKDAEAHAEEDRKFRELVDARNQADALIHAAEKSLADLGDEVEEDERKSVEEAIASLKQAVEGDDREAIDAGVATLTERSGKLAERAYRKAQAGEGPGQAASDGGGGASAADDVVDAEFEEVGDDKK